MPMIYHYTDKDGYNGIRSAPDWIFKAHQPPKDHPSGAYFSRLLPNRSLLANRLRVPDRKVEYCFEFEDNDDLKEIPGDRGQRGISLFSPTNYIVPKARQGYNGLSKNWKETP